MRKVVLSPSDFVLFNTEITQREYDFYSKHKDAFKRMWQSQGKRFWSTFVQCFRAFSEKYGTIKDLPGNPEKYKKFTDFAFDLIRDSFVQGKFSSAKELINDVVTLAQNNNSLQYLESKSYSKDPFYKKETRDSFRKLFGPQDSKDSYLKVYFLGNIYQKFAGGVVECLRLWLDADDIEETDYWPENDPKLDEKKRHTRTFSPKSKNELHKIFKDEFTEVDFFAGVADVFFKEMEDGSSDGPMHLEYLGWPKKQDPRFYDHQNPLWAPKPISNPDEDWRCLVTAAAFRLFFFYLKEKHEISKQSLKKEKKKRKKVEYDDEGYKIVYCDQCHLNKCMSSLIKPGKHINLMLHKKVIDSKTGKVEIRIDKKMPNGSCVKEKSIHYMESCKDKPESDEEASAKALPPPPSSPPPPKKPLAKKDSGDGFEFELGGEKHKYGKRETEELNEAIIDCHKSLQDPPLKITLDDLQKHKAKMQAFNAKEEKSIKIRDRLNKKKQGKTDEKHNIMERFERGEISKADLIRQLQLEAGHYELAEAKKDPLRTHCTHPVMVPVTESRPCSNAVAKPSTCFTCQTKIGGSYLDGSGSICKGENHVHIPCNAGCNHIESAGPSAAATLLSKVQEATENTEKEIHTGCCDHDKDGEQPSLRAQELKEKKEKKKSQKKAEEESAKEAFEKEKAAKLAEREAAKEKRMKKLKACAYCEVKEPKPKIYKKCQRCKQDNVDLPKYYCGRDCQVKDWNASHKEDHKAPEATSRILDLD